MKDDTSCLHQRLVVAFLDRLFNGALWKHHGGLSPLQQFIKIGYQLTRTLEYILQDILM